MHRVIRVLLVSSDEAMKEVMGHILISEEGIKIVGTARSSEEALTEAKALCPDVILMLTDINISGMDGIDTARAINEAQLPARAIIITENPIQYLVPTIRAGAAGLLPKDISRDELLSAIRKIHLWSPVSFASR